MHLKKIGRKMLVKIKSNPRKKRKIKRFGTLLRALQHYCTNTTLHGLRYIVDPELHPIERFLWLLIFGISSITASNVIYILALKYQSAPTYIGIESMSYKISGIPFPSVTLCPNDRVDWDKALELEAQIFPNSTDKETLKTFREILMKLSIITFGDFDELDFLKKRRLDNLAHINVTDVLLKVLPNCKDLFTDCWWRTSYRNCCEIFELQKTEYGFCYSFNSQLAYPSGTESRNGQRKEERPRRASGYGEWSGVKVTIHLGNVTKPPNSVEIEGVVLMLNDPRVWPNSGSMIPTGSLTSISMDPISGYATKPVLELDETKSPCRHVKSKSYNQETCLSLCKRTYVVKHCGCNPSFLFPPNSQRECNIKDFLCLTENNVLFNDYHVSSDDAVIDDGNVMICDCPPECEYYMYIAQTSGAPLLQPQDIMLDVHFSSQTSFRYKTDIVITNLDLLVSFGGIIGLFLGGSLLSAAELIYHLMVVVFCYLRSYREARRKEVRVVKPIVRGASTVLALPILDYGPVKPRSRRIPILVNYASVKSNSNRY